MTTGHSTPAQVLELVATLLESKAQVERLHGENNLFSHPDFERIQSEAREAAARFYALDPNLIRAQAAALAERDARIRKAAEELIESYTGEEKLPGYTPLIRANWPALYALQAALLPAPTCPTQEAQQ